MLHLYPVNQDVRALAFPHFPTRLQAVVWRNWGRVPLERLSRTLRATDLQLIRLAEAMGLPAHPTVDGNWLKRGYVTLIRANWHLLPYEQLLDLLDWTPEQLAFALKEDDFLWVKLGHFKPLTEPVYYRPLTPEEEARTRILQARVLQTFASLNAPAKRERPFEFIDRLLTKSNLAVSNPDVSYQAVSDQVVSNHAASNQAAADPEQPNVANRLWRVFDDVRLSGVCAADRGASAEAGADFATLTNRWTIFYPPDVKHAGLYAERFAQAVFRHWGVKLRAAPDEGAGVDPNEPHVLLKVQPEHGLRAESHHIRVLPGRIEITAVDGAGLLRGLQWIQHQMMQNRGPCVAVGSTQRRTKIELRYVYSYFGVFGDPLTEPELDPYPDELLEALSELGINGVWLHSVLYQLVPFDHAPELSTGWERRIEGLRKLTERAAKYGIGVYLYYNEPRAMPLSFFRDRPEWMGHVEGNHACLCTSHPEVQQYLQDSTARLFREVPELAGIFTITMSENLTNCYSRTASPSCPRCNKRLPEKVAAEVIRCIAAGARSVKPDARIICWLWGWNWPLEQVKNGIRQLPAGVAVMCTSEEGMPTNVGGVENRVIDYAMSVAGPGEKARACWQTALACGMTAAAKVQLNITWECSAVPFLPVYELIEQHLTRLQDSGVTALQLSWTPGGYPSLNLELASAYYWETSDNAPNVADKDREADEFSVSAALFARKFGKVAGQAVIKASRQFSSAFREFPFHIEVLYHAPQNFGPANLLYWQPTGYRATMIGFPYDDLEGWRGNYPPDIFAAQFRKLAEGWQAGVRTLLDSRSTVDEPYCEAYDEMIRIASAAGAHFQSAANQIEFVICRDQWLASESEAAQHRAKSRLLELVDDEIRVTRELLAHVRADSRIGFEASNHYYYSERELLEKVLNCLEIRDRLTGTKDDR
jgi:hypothetical protein